MDLDQEEHRRALAEKMRLDPPPQGKEWSLAYDDQGQRIPAQDLLVSTDPPADLTQPSYGLSKATLPGAEQSGERPEGFDYGAAGHGVSSELVDAVLERWAGRHRRYIPGTTGERYRDAAAADVLRTALGVFAPESGEGVPVRDLARLAALTVCEELQARDGM
jgi:hypothetical protein